MLNQKQQSSDYQEAVAAMQIFIKKTKPKSSSVVKKSFVVALFLSAPSISNQNQSQLLYTNKIGLLQLDVDRQLKSKVLRFYDMLDGQLLLQFQLYYGFKEEYNAHEQKGICKRKLYTFEVPPVPASKLDQIINSIKSKYPTKNSNKSPLSFPHPLYQGEDHVFRKINRRIVGFLFKNADQAAQMRTIIQKNSPELQLKKNQQKKNQQVTNSNKENQGNSNKSSQNSIFPHDLKQLCRSWQLSQQEMNDPQVMKILLYQILKIQAKKTKNAAMLKKIQEYEKKFQQDYGEQKKKKIKNKAPKKNQNVPIQNAIKTQHKNQKIVNINQISPTKLHKFHPSSAKQIFPQQNNSQVEVNKQQLQQNSKQIQVKFQQSSIEKQLSSIIQSQKKQQNCQKRSEQKSQEMAKSIFKLANKICPVEVSQNVDDIKVGEAEMESHLQRIREKLIRRRLALKRRQASDNQQQTNNK